MKCAVGYRRVMARAYEMRVRADAAAATRDAILDATIALALELERVDFPLDQVAARAGRSVKTILRHFGSRDALIEQAVQRGSARVAAERAPSTTGDRGEAVRLLVEHYETWGRFVMRLLAMGDDGDAPAVTSPGRLLHRDWVQQTFGTTDEAVVDQLVVATDVYAWKLLRVDRGLPAADVTARILSMTEAIAP